MATDLFIDVNKETLIPFGINETMYNELYSINLRYNVKTMKYSWLINKGLKWTIREKKYLKKHNNTLEIKEEYLDKINSKKFSKKKYSEAYKYKKIIENEKDKIKEKKLILEKLKNDNEAIEEIIKGKKANKTITSEEKKELEQQIKNNKQAIKDNKKFIKQSENAIMDIEIGMKSKELLFFKRKSLSDNPTKKVNIILKKDKEKKIRFNKSIKSPDRSV